jgi:hypothetical protein
LTLPEPDDAFVDAAAVGEVDAVDDVPVPVFADDAPFEELPHAASTVPAAARARTARTRRKVLEGPLFMAMSLLI